MIGEGFTRDRGEAQHLDRHTDMTMTEDADLHLDAKNYGERLDSLLEEIKQLGRRRTT